MPRHNTAQRVSKGNTEDMAASELEHYYGYLYKDYFSSPQGAPGAVAELYSGLNKLQENLLLKRTRLRLACWLISVYLKTPIAEREFVS